jgi:hypothetical protein
MCRAFEGWRSGGRLIVSGLRAGHPDCNDAQGEPFHDVHERLAAIEVDRLRWLDKMSAAGLH